MLWLNGWNYRCELVISSQVFVTDYQVKIVVGESIDVSGADIVCEGCLNNFNDIRFTSSDGSALLNYWIEDIVGTTPLQKANVWVKIPEISNSTIIYAYWGNSLATSSSNGAQTFIFFDDASSSNQLSNYTLNVINPVPGSGNFTWNNGYYSLKTTNSGHIYAKINSINLKNVALHTEIFRETNATNQQGGVVFCVENENSYCMSRYITTTVNMFQLYHLNGGPATIANYTLPQSTWFKTSVGVGDTKAKATWKNLDGTLIDELEYTLPQINSGNWGLFGAYDINSINRFRKIFVRKYISEEPTISPFVYDSSINRIKLLSYDGNSTPIYLPMPQLDNSAEINMAFKVYQTSDMTIRYFDNGQNYDSITSKAKYLLTKEEIDNFIDFYEDQTRGRADTFRFELSQNSGYYPFGPDLGDTGIFYCKFVDAKWTTRLNKPWGMYELELSLHLISAPNYEITTITYKQGSFILDDLVNLPNPEIQYNYEKHLFTKTSLGGKLNNVDIGLSDYMHSSNLSFDVSVQNAGMLISKLKSIRTNTFTITSPINCYPFGSKIGSGSFLVNLLDNTINITHNGPNNFRIEFQVGLQNVI